MTVHELLENAVKYAASPDELVQCELSVLGEMLLVRVTNPATDERLLLLRDAYATVATGDPLDVYLERMEASVSSDSSQLGLARIRYEGEAELDVTATEGRAIVEARFAMPTTTEAAA
jgi:hypothetical protein